MRYLPKSPAERKEMLDSIGVASVQELFESIPRQFRLNEPLPLPGPLSEAEIIRYFQDRAAENSRGYTSFLGAGVYQHLRSVVTDALVQRGEFLTSYTPYQAEIAQGTLTAIFEFQTLMCQLTGQDVANASMYDGSTALTEAVLMAERLKGRQRVLVARSVHPEYRHVLSTYATNLGLNIEEIGYAKSGKLDRTLLLSEKLAKASALVVQSPNYFGVIEDLPNLAEAAHSAGALLVTSVTEGVSLGILQPPAHLHAVRTERVHRIADVPDAELPDEEVGCEIAAHRDHELTELRECAAAADRGVEPGFRVVRRVEAEGRAIDQARELVRQNQGVVEAQLPCVHLVIELDEHRHLHGAGRVERLIGAHE